VFIVFTPKNAANLAFDYVTPMKSKAFKVHLDASYAAATQTFDQTPVTNDSSVLLNGRLVLSDFTLGNGGLMTLSLWARNLLDEQYVYRRDPANRAVLGDYGNFNAARTYGVSVNFEF
jgi:iron complex outermembrane receptor protein